MAILRFGADRQGFADAAAVPEPKFIWTTPGSRILVFTGADVPNTTTPVEDLVVTRFQLIRALAMAGKAGATTTAIAGMSVARQTLWAEANTFKRGYEIIRALKRELPNVNDADMDAIFVAASALVESEI